MGFKAFDQSLTLIRDVRPFMPKIRRYDSDLCRQLRKAATSTPLNLSEGSIRTGQDATHLFRVARGSAKEVQAALLVAEAWGYLSEREIAVPLASVDRVLALTWGLC